MKLQDLIALESGGPGSGRVPYGKKNKLEPDSKGFDKAVGVKTRQITENAFHDYMDTPKGEATILLKNVYDNKGTVEIHWLIAEQRGAGRAALEHITSTADKFHIPLQLWAQPLAGQGENKGFSLSKSKLEKFYKDFDFKVVRRQDGIAQMKRNPK